MFPVVRSHQQIYGKLSCCLFKRIKIFEILGVHMQMVARIVLRDQIIKNYCRIFISINSESYNSFNYNILVVIISTIRSAVFPSQYCGILPFLLDPFSIETAIRSAFSGSSPAR